MGNTKSTIATLNVTAFMGKWWEMSSLPNGFSSGCSRIAMVYTYNSARKTIDVIHECYNGENIVRAQKGVIWMPDSEEPGKLMIQFEGGGPGSGVPEDYWILWTDYSRFAVIGGEPDNQLWILSRHPMICLNEYKYLLSVAEENGYNVSQLIVYPNTILR